MSGEWNPQSNDEVLRPSRVRQLLAPLRERRFTYAAYDAFLGRLRSDPRVLVVPLREFRSEGEVVVGLRHDVDDRLDSALVLAELEHRRGIRSTYFVLHTAPYWESPDLIPSLQRLQALGHEVGFHNDLVTLERVHGVDAGAFLRSGLARLRAAGIDVDGVAAHGSIWCHRRGFHNNYAFVGWDELVDGFPSRDGLPKLDPADFGLVYEAYHLGEDAYSSDSTFDRGGRRWHPELFDPARLARGDRAIVLVHPCHWDASVAAKAARVALRAATKLGGRQSELGAAPPQARSS